MNQQGSIWPGVLVVGMLLWAVGTTQITTRRTMAQPMSGGEVVLVAPAVAEAPVADSARGVFYARAMTLTIPLTTTHIWLASSPDGQGAVCSDDQVTVSLISLNGGYHQVYHWVHDFISADGQGIECLTPQETAIQLEPGQYRVEIVLEDLRPTTYGSRPYYLGVVPMEPPLPAATSTPTPPPPVHDQQAMLPTVASPVPVATPTTALSGDAPIIEKPREGVWPDGAASPVLLAAAGGVAALTAVGTAMALVARRRRAPVPTQMTGMLDILDHDTLESCTALLSTYPQGVMITRHPLQVSAQRAIAAQGEVIATIVPGAQGPVCYGHSAGSSNGEGVALAQLGSKFHRLAGGTVALWYRK